MWHVFSRKKIKTYNKSIVKYGIKLKIFLGKL